MLARLEHENMIEAIALAGANAEGAVVRRGDGVALIATGLPLRLFNQVIVEGDDARVDAVRAAVALTRARGDQFVVNLRVGTDDRLSPLMQELGLLPISEEPTPGMALHPISAGAGPDPLPDHEIRQVTDTAGVEDHIKTAAAGFELPEAVLRSIITPTMAQRAGFAAYVGYTEHGPVTTGLGIRTGRTIGAYNIATLPAARRRGYGAAMTARVIADGAAAGCDVAILQSSRMGHSVYERLGFRTVVEYMGYIEPPGDKPAAGVQ
ncbi:MAG TPA: GNAT family N-acetyltransferase [Candidatus Limnocylindria bacterium]|nr:GNAT family N-acetyltransferase [Candidatus Limnocylindria bacterium]